MPPKNDARRGEILEAVEQLFRRGMACRVTIEDVARLAKISKGTIYVHFADKSELFFQAEMHRMEMLLDMLRERVPEGLPFFDKLVETSRLIDEFFHDRVPIIRPGQFLRPSASPETIALQKQWRAARAVPRAHIAEIIRQGAAEGTVRPEIDPDAAAGHWMAVMMSRRLEHVQGEPAPSIEQALELFAFGVANSGPRLRQELSRAEERHAAE